jgi:hypothetical protein
VVVSVALCGASLALSLVLLRRLGVAGAAWGLLLPMLAVSAAYVTTAARLCDVSLPQLARRVSGGCCCPCLPV